MSLISRSLFRNALSRQVSSLSAFFSSTSLYQAEDSIVNHKFTAGDLHAAPEREYSPPTENLAGIERREKALSVAAHFFQSAVKKYLAQKPNRLYASSLLYAPKKEDGSDILESARYLQRELPVRLARRIHSYHLLPFIVGSHPAIISTLEAYQKAFRKLSDFPIIVTHEDEIKYTKMLTNLFEANRHTIALLAEGFQEIRNLKVATAEVITPFLNGIVTSRLSTRILTEHHIALHQEKDGYVGIINLNFSPKKLVQKVARQVTAMCEQLYGSAPEVKVDGFTEATFPYIEPPLEFILDELLTNSMAAVVRTHVGSASKLPPIRVTVACSDVDFTLRVSDKGGGIKPENIRKVFEYNYSSVAEEEENAEQEQGDKFMPDFDQLSASSAGSAASTGRSSAVPGGLGPMHGFGFGLSTSRAYANFLGGALRLEPMLGIGTDAYVNLTHIDGPSSFRI